MTGNNGHVADVSANVVKLRSAEPLPLLDMPRLRRLPAPPIPWLMEPLLIRGRVTMLAGKPGIGKTMLALGLLDAYTGGASVSGLEVAQPGRALMLDAENGQDETLRRLEAMGTPLDAPIAVSEFPDFQLAKEADRARLAATIRTTRADVVVLDSLTSLAPGAEENEVKVAPILHGLARIAREQDAAVLLLHHTLKNANVYRGHSSIDAAVWMNFILERAGDGLLKLASHKSRSGAEPAPIYLRIAATADSIAFVGGKAPRMPSQAGRPSRQSERAEDILRALAAADGTFDSKAELARAVGTTPDHKTFSKALDRLVVERLVDREGRRIIDLRAGQAGAGHMPARHGDGLEAAA